MKIEKFLTKAEKDIESILNKLEEPMKKSVSFIKKHKKLLVSLGVIYFIYSYLFDED